ncbi:hypothetical protein L1049_014407 [Liquidambar formosana]|uniref:Uncharacterized protein n=1 Tax=Liquidambar formosana TaxID=63359 RepID=A0AAP0RM62_LIQFO
MASASSTPPKENARFPPKRGQIKVRIFEDLVKKVVSVASKAGEALGRIGGDGSSGESSASVTSPPSSYNSDGNPDIS